MQPVFRFAPSPNGHLHLGHAYSALLNAQMAAESGGRFLVRIEDIDTLRCTEQLVGYCLEDLAWLGLSWEEPVMRQSRQFPRYGAAIAELHKGGFLYPCFCSRGDIARAAGAHAPRDPDGALLYPLTCRHLTEGERAARLSAGDNHGWRLDLEAALAAIGPETLTWQELDRPESGAGQGGHITARPQSWGDALIVRKDIPTSYTLAVVLDDAIQGVTHVVRGHDLYHATAMQRVVQTLLGLAAPIYHHHRLLLDETGRKLAKSAASTPLRKLRAEATTASDIRRRLGFA